MPVGVRSSGPTFAAAAVTESRKAAVEQNPRSSSRLRCVGRISSMSPAAPRRSASAGVTHPEATVSWSSWR